MNDSKQGLINYLESFNGTIEKLCGAVYENVGMNQEVYKESDYIELRRLYINQGAVVVNELTKLYLIYSPDADLAGLKSLCEEIVKILQKLVSSVRVLIEMSYCACFKSVITDSALLILSSIEKMILDYIEGIRSDSKDLPTQSFGVCKEYCEKLKSLPKNIKDGVITAIKLQLNIIDDSFNEFSDLIKEIDNDEEEESMEYEEIEIEIIKESLVLIADIKKYIKEVVTVIDKNGFYNNCTELVNICKNIVDGVTDYCSVLYPPLDQPTFNPALESIKKVIINKHKEINENILVEIKDEGVEEIFMSIVNKCEELYKLATE